MAGGMMSSGLGQSAVSPYSLGGYSIGSANGQGLPGLGQSNMNGMSMWQNQFGGFYK